VVLKTLAKRVLQAAKQCTWRAAQDQHIVLD